MREKIEQLKSAGYIELVGNLRIQGNNTETQFQGDIVNDSRVYHTDGSLTINGNVADGSKLFVFGGDVHIKGNIGTNVEIEVAQGSLTVVGNIGEKSTLDAQNGDIRCASVAKDAGLSSYHGDIFADSMDERSSANTFEGDIVATNAHPKATLVTSIGFVTKNGITNKENEELKDNSVMRRKRDNPKPSAYNVRLFDKYQTRKFGTLPVIEYKNSDKSQDNSFPAFRSAKEKEEYILRFKK